MANQTNGRIAWLQLALTALIIGGGLWSFAIAPIKSDVTRASVQADTASTLAASNKSNLDTVTAQNATSIKDRDELNWRTGQLENKNAALETLTAQNEERNAQRLTEIETQFDSMAQTNNTTLSYQNQINSNVQNALSGLAAKIPPAPNLPLFYPNISNRDGRKK